MPHHRRVRTVPPRAAQVREIGPREQRLERALRLGRAALVQEANITNAAIRVIDNALSREQ